MMLSGKILRNIQLILIISTAAPAPALASDPMDEISYLINQLPDADKEDQIRLGWICNSLTRRVYGQEAAVKTAGHMLAQMPGEVDLQRGQELIQEAVSVQVELSQRYLPKPGAMVHARKEACNKAKAHFPNLPTEININQ
jgi:hypothetical protein